MPNLKRSLLLSLATLLLLSAGALLTGPALVLASAQATVTSTPINTPTPTALAATPTTISATPTARAAVTQALVSDAEIKNGLDKYFGDLYTSKRFSGVVFVAQNGRVLYEKSFGETMIPPLAPLTSTTKFRIGSVTKQFTAAAILKLQGQGKLNVQENLCTYLKPCPEAWDKITLRQLLTHTAGIAPSNINLFQPHTSAELVAEIGKALLHFEPGTKFEYSNDGYYVLGALIEQLSGKTYEAFLRETFLDPLGMKDTGITIDEELLGGAPTYMDFSNLIGAGSMYSTIADLYRWTQALDAWERDPASEYQAMFEPQVGEDFNPNYLYTYGLEVVQQKGHRYVGHPGGLGGSYSSHVGRYPDSELTFIILSNVDFLVDQADIANIIFGAK